MAKITIINQPIYNRGDQAAFRALIRLLKERQDLQVTVLFFNHRQGVEAFMEGIKNVEYVVFSKLNKKKRFYKRLLYSPKPLRRMIGLLPAFRRYNQHIRNADYVLCAPGGIDIGGYRNWKDLWQLTNAVDYKKKLGIYGRSIGPFDGHDLSGRLFKQKAVDVLKKVDYLSLRDRQSQHIADEMGISYVPTIDTAFACRPNGRIPEELRFLEGRKYAVLVPNQLYAWHRRYKRYPKASFNVVYKSLIERLLGDEYNVALMPHLFGREKVDHSYCEHLANDYDENVFVIPDAYDSDVQQAIVRKASLVVGARSHSIIFAINNHVPFLCLSYEHKMDGMLELLGLSKYSLQIEALVEGRDAHKMVDLLDSITACRDDSIVNTVAAARLKAQRTVQKAFDEFISRFTTQNGM